MPATVDVTTRPATTAVMTDVVTDHEHFADAFDVAVRSLVAYMREQRIEPSGPGFAQYHELANDGPWHATVGFPVDEPGPGTSHIRGGRLPGGRVAVIVHDGPYEGLAERWSEIGEWIRTHGLTPSAAPWESYVVEDSTDPEPSRWRTEIVWPVN